MTRTRRAVAALALIAALGGLVACGGDADQPSATSSTTNEPTSSTPTPTPSGPTPLPSGKSDLPVTAGTYTSPEGFRPSLVMTIPSGWTSIHRSADAFDLGKPDPTRDAPLVAVVVLRPSATDATAALSAVREQATGGVEDLIGRLAGRSADGLDITGGSGELVSSADGSIALDAAPGQRVRLLATDTEGGPLVAVVLVPDGTRWESAWPPARALLSGFRLGS